MLVIAAFEVSCAIGGAVYFAARTAMSVGRDIRLSLVRRVGQFSAREHGKFGAHR